MKKAVLSAMLLGFSSITNAAILFQEDFENGLSFGSGNNWSSNYSGVIVSDPLQSDKALEFTKVTGGGDLISNYFSSTTGIFDISFDYMGNCGTGACGGFFWNSRTGWDGDGSGGYRDTLVDDTGWNTYNFQVTGSTLQIRLEDWVGSAGYSNIAGGAFFDNIVITDGKIPEPSVLALMAMGLLGLGMTARRKKSI